MQYSLGECGLRYINLGSDDEIVPLTSPGYPVHYRNDLVCEWTVSATGTRIITATIENFDMEEGFDFLILGNGERSSGSGSSVSGSGSGVIVRLTGHGSKVRVVTSGEPNMWIKVATDRTGIATGFLIHVSQVADAVGNVSPTPLCLIIAVNRFKNI